MSLAFPSGSELCRQQQGLDSEWGSAREPYGAGYHDAGPSEQHTASVAESLHVLPSDWELEPKGF